MQAELQKVKSSLIGLPQIPHRFVSSSSSFSTLFFLQGSLTANALFSIILDNLSASAVLPAFLALAYFVKRFSSSE
jgi:hypothetical protein